MIVGVLAAVALVVGVAVVVHPWALTSQSAPPLGPPTAYAPATAVALTSTSVVIIPTSTVPPTTVPPTTAAPATTVPSDACSNLAFVLATPDRSSTVNPMALVANDQLAPLPAPILPPRTDHEVGLIPTPESYVDGSDIPDPAGRIQVMKADGYQGGIAVQFQNGPDNYFAFVLQFRDGPAAMNYLAAHLEDVCGEAETSNPLPGLPGISLDLSGGDGRAVFVVGNSEIGLTICTCVGVSDRGALAAQWAEAIAKQLPS